MIWGGFQSLAVALLDGPEEIDREARIRAAVSRSYYAAYGALKIALLPLFGDQYEENDKSKHNWVTNMLGKDAFQPELRKEMDQFHAIRKVADYASDISEHEEGNTVPYDTESFLELAEIWIKEKAPFLIKQAMEITEETKEGTDVPEETEAMDPEAPSPKEGSK